MIVITVESKLRLRKKYLSEKVIAQLKRLTTYTDPVYAARKRQHISTEDLTRRIKTWEEDTRDLLFWRGSLGPVIRVLKKAGIKYEIQDQRLWLPKIDLSCQIKLRDYQIPGVNKMIKRQQTVIRADCGSGKTEMLLKVVAHFQQPTLILVWCERQQKTWVDRIPQYFDFWPGGIGGAYVKPILDRPIVIGMIQTVRNHLAELKYRFGCVICDEVDRFAAPTLRECVNEFPAAVRLGASDDERRRDEREFLIYDTFGPRSWKLQQKVECPVDIVLVPSTFQYSRGNITSMVYEWQGLIDEFVDDSARNNLILTLACREVDAGRRVLIWSERVAHCKYLQQRFFASGYHAGLMLGGKSNKKETDATETGLRDGSVEIGIGTSVAEKAVNIPPLDVGIMTCASAGRKMYRFKQMRGRLVRPYEGKEKATLYYIFDKLVPKLRRKKNNIQQLYHIREMVQLYKHKEKGTMPSEHVAVTQDTLKAGCNQLDITIPKGATAKKLKKLIERELAKNKTYGSYTCGACYCDIVDKLAVCPFCQAKFKPVAEEDDFETEEELDEGVDEEEVDEDEEEEPEDEEEDEEEEPEDEVDDDEDEEPEDEDEDEEPEDEDEEEDEEEVDEDEEEEPEDEEEVDEDEEPEDEEEDEEEVDEDEEEEPEPPKKKKKTKKAKGTSKSAKAKHKAVKLSKEQEKEAKREQIRTELPYTKKQLTGMKRTTLMMIASILGIKHPLRLGTSESAIKAICKVQRAKYGDSSSKGTVKKGKKVKSKKKKRS